MKAAVAGIGAAVAASACCIGPVVFTLLGSGALSAASVRLVPYRPWLIGVTACLVGLAFYGAYRPASTECSADGTCSPQSTRMARILVWIAAGAAAVLIAFPYYIGWFVD
jgi:mercuric ion transport protein